MVTFSLVNVSLLVPFILFVLFIIKLYIKSSTGRCTSSTCLVGKTAVITGGNTGLGYETALDFAKRGSRVILACRDETKANEARRKIIAETGNVNIVVKHVDMASFRSVRALAKNILETEDRLDILINNAGILEAGPNKVTEDSFGLLMQVNYLSSFLLTNLLLGLMERTGRSRVVNISSDIVKFVYKFDPNSVGLHPGNRYVYHHSKLCNALFTIELAKRLKGTEVTTYCLHPGIVYTEIFRNLKAGLRNAVLHLCRKHFLKNIEEGAQTIIYCAVEKGIEGDSGGLFRECRRVSHYRAARASGLANKLWDLTEKLCNCTFNQNKISTK